MMVRDAERRIRALLREDGSAQRSPTWRWLTLAALVGLSQCFGITPVDQDNPSCGSVTSVQEIYAGQESRVVANDEELTKVLPESPCSMQLIKAGFHCEIHLSLPTLRTWKSGGDFSFGIVTTVLQNGHSNAVQVDEMSCELTIDGDPAECTSYQGTTLFGCRQIPVGAQEMTLRCSPPPFDVVLDTKLYRYDCPP